MEEDGENHYHKVQFSKYIKIMVNTDFKFEEHNFTTEFPIKVGLIVTMVELRFSNPVV